VLVTAYNIPDLNAPFSYCFEIRQEQKVKKIQLCQHSSYGALESFKYTQTSLQSFPFQSHDLQMQFFERGTSPEVFVVFYKG